MVTLRIGAWSVLAGGAAGSAGRDAVPDGDLLRADEDVLDEEPQHALAVRGVGGGGAAAELGEEAFQVIGELEVGVAVLDPLDAVCHSQCPDQPTSPAPPTPIEVFTYAATVSTDLAARVEAEMTDQNSPQWPPPHPRPTSTTS